MIPIDCNPYFCGNPILSKSIKSGRKSHFEIERFGFK